MQQVTRIVQASQRITNILDKLSLSEENYSLKIIEITKKMASFNLETFGTNDF